MPPFLSMQSLYSFKWLTFEEDQISVYMSSVTDHHSASFRINPILLSYLVLASQILCFFAPHLHFHSLNLMLSIKYKSWRRRGLNKYIFLVNKLLIKYIQQIYPTNIEGSDYICRRRVRELIGEHK